MCRDLGPPPAGVLQCGGEGGLNDEDATAQLLNLGAELRTRASGQRADAVEARNGMLRVVVRAVEEYLKRQGCPIVFKRILAGCIFPCSTFASHDGAPPCRARARAASRRCRPSLMALVFLDLRRHAENENAGSENSWRGPSPEQPRLLGPIAPSGPRPRQTVAGCSRWGTWSTTVDRPLRWMTAADGTDGPS